MTKRASAQGDWQAVTDAHPLESHDPEEWLRHGVALMQTIQPGADVGSNSSRRYWRFVAQKEGASDRWGAAAAVSTVEPAPGSATLAKIPVPVHLWAGEGSKREAGAPSPAGAAAGIDRSPSTSVGAGVAAAASVLDQLLAAKEQLRGKEITVAAVEEALSQECPNDEPAWDAALKKVLLVLR